MNASRRHLRCARASRVARARALDAGRGFSLIVAMLMLAVIGLAAAAIMRNATSGEQVANGNRLQMQASQYAQLALRFCETQLALPSAARSVALLPVATPPAWSVRQNWTSPGPGSAHALAAAEIGSAVQPHVAPQCLMEATAVPEVYTLTARGFSADFKADPTGATRNGSAVWLQATVYAQAESDPADASPTAVSDASAGPQTVRQRLWQQLLTPPF